MNKNLHIICLDVPYPPDYGGAYVMYHDIKQLYENGVKIHLHCFSYGRQGQPILEKFCERIYYYKRSKSFMWLPRRIPYIVYSRRTSILLENILKDDYPLLIQGVHCTWHLYTKSLANRQVVVRLHNVESEYYRRLAFTSGNFLKKIFFLTESILLRKYENKIVKNNQVLALTPKDKKTLQHLTGMEDIGYLPAFLPSQNILSQPGNGNFNLYHGNLSVSENEKAVIWLVNNVYQKLEMPLIIAGKNPSQLLKKILRKKNQVYLIANPGEKEMNQLIQDAHIHLLPSFNNTGIKIKILNALRQGRFVMTNGAAIEGTGLECLCISEENAEGFAKKIAELFGQPFTRNDIQYRKEVFSELYSNEKTLQKMTGILWRSTE